MVNARTGRSRRRCARPSTARVDAAAEVGGDLDVGDQALADGVIQHLAEPGDDLVLRSVVGGELRAGREVRVPVRTDLHTAVSGQQCAARRDGMDAGEQRPVGAANTVHLGQERVGVPPRGHAEREQRLDLRRDVDTGAQDGVVQRLDAETVPHRDEAPTAFVGDDDRELATQPVHEVTAELLVQAQRDLAVRVGDELPALRRELLPDGAVPVQLAVDHAMHVAGVIDQRLVAVRQPDDAEAYVPEHHPTVAREPPGGVVGTAMCDAIQRAGGLLIRQARFVKQGPYQSAHDGTSSSRARQERYRTQAGHGRCTASPITDDVGIQLVGTGQYAGLNPDVDFSAVTPTRPSRRLWEWDGRSSACRAR